MRADAQAPPRDLQYVARPTARASLCRQAQAQSAGPLHRRDADVQRTHRHRACALWLSARGRAHGVAARASPGGQSLARARRSILELPAFSPEAWPRGRTCGVARSGCAGFARSLRPTRPTGACTRGCTSGSHELAKRLVSAVRCCRCQIPLAGGARQAAAMWADKCHTTRKAIAASAQFRPSAPRRCPHRAGSADHAPLVPCTFRPRVWRLCGA